VRIAQVDGAALRASPGAGGAPVRDAGVMSTLDINGVPVHVDVTGDGEPVVFLHGGFCSAEVMRPISQELSGYAVHAPERPAHGRTPDRPGPFSYAAGVADTVAYLDAVGLERAQVVGFSDGAIIGLMLALAHPERVASLVFISGNLVPEGVHVPEDQHATALPESEWVRVSDEYARLSPDGAEHADDVFGRIQRMWETEPAIEQASLAAITIPAMVMAGDHDIISLDHTRVIADGIPGSQLCIVPGTSHFLVREKPELIGLVLQQFLDSVARG
jgi:pimeloyl-ACP methyl ester carboxylesterase